MPRLQAEVDLNCPPEDAKDSSKDPKKNQKYSEASYKCFCCLGYMGICGMHRCYLRNSCEATKMLCTCGYCGFRQCKDYKNREYLLAEANAGRLQSPADDKCCCIWKGICFVALIAASCI